MNVVVAEHLGMCFGVKRALDIADSVSQPERVTMLGEIVHNEQIVSALAARGYVTQPESAGTHIPDTPAVLITAHGISDRQRHALLAAGKSLHDTTCPLVTRVHKVARMLADKGYFIVVIGRHGHVEVRGLTGDLDAFEVVERVDEVRAYGQPRLGVVCQTTTAPAEAAQIREAIAAANPEAEIRFIDTICHPTKARQQAVESLLPDVDALVVVGGRTSNNTRRLGDLAEARAVPWHHVQTVDDIDPEWRNRYRSIGLTAGTSTPDEAIEAVRERLMAL